MDLLLLLIERPMNIEEIKGTLNVTTSAMMTQIKVLIDQGLIVYDNDLYNLSHFGEVIVRKIIPLVNTLKVYSDNIEYWESHKFNSIPTGLQDRVEELGDCELIEPDLNRMYELPLKLENNLAKAEYIREVSSYFSPAYPSKYLELARKGVNISLIVSAPVFERLRNEYGSVLKEFLGMENVDIYVHADTIGLASCIVTNSFLSFSLFFKNGIYHNHAMMSFDESSFNWGKDLFEHFRSNSSYIEQM
ncbi:winged helix-turn-helix domain-containing protein [Methanolobus sp.]|uniref:helix-turn-helix transcriptional regulator n=1 Tax=Methanolobus sp. TaxID=1874737 RepID=UPI0027304106|nr:winged helix-turn-helix domain-containing protein [Methanolobus sp.]